MLGRVQALRCAPALTGASGGLDPAARGALIAIAAGSVDDVHVAITKLLRCAPPKGAFSTGSLRLALPTRVTADLSNSLDVGSNARWRRRRYRARERGTPPCMETCDFELTAAQSSRPKSTRFWVGLNQVDRRDHCVEQLSAETVAAPLVPADRRGQLRGRRIAEVNRFHRPSRSFSIRRFTESQGSRGISPASIA